MRSPRSYVDAGSQNGTSGNIRDLIAEVAFPDIPVLCARRWFVWISERRSRNAIADCHGAQRIWTCGNAAEASSAGEEFAAVWADGNFHPATVPFASRQLRGAQASSAGIEVFFHRAVLPPRRSRLPFCVGTLGQRNPSAITITRDEQYPAMIREGIGIAEKELAKLVEAVF